MRKMQELAQLDAKESAKGAAKSGMTPDPATAAAGQDKTAATKDIGKEKQAGAPKDAAAQAKPTATKDAAAHTNAAATKDAAAHTNAAAAKDARPNKEAASGAGGPDKGQPVAGAGQTDGAGLAGSPPPGQGVGAPGGMPPGMDPQLAEDPSATGQAPPARDVLMQQLDRIGKMRDNMLEIVNSILRQLAESAKNVWRGA
jgi:hypothetical protein